MKYICYFDYRDKDNIERSNPPAGASKLMYIAECISHYEKVEIISASGVVGNCTDRSRVKWISEKLSVQYFFSLGRKNKLIGQFGTLILHLQLFYFLLFRTHQDEQVLVYHSLGYMNIVRLAHKIKKFNLILEVEEIYSDVIENKRLRLKEIDFAKSAEKYIFPTQMLSRIINTQDKPEVIIHGAYQVVPDRKCNVFVDNLQNQNERTIHCVYAGTLDPRKGGAVAAAAAAEYLPFSYHIHILGFGSGEEIQKMKDLTEKIAKISKAKVSYDGLLSGEDYIRFIQSCDIGLSTQNPSAAFNGTSFPSKILSYMANGLRVVSVKIPAIETSAVGNELFYYDDQTPEKIARAIMKINIDDEYNSRLRIKELNQSILKEMKSFLQ